MASRTILRLEMGFDIGITKWPLLKSSSLGDPCPFGLPVMLTVAYIRAKSKNPSAQFTLALGFADIIISMWIKTDFVQATGCLVGVSRLALRTFTSASIICRDIEYCGILYATCSLSNLMYYISPTTG